MHTVVSVEEKLPVVVGVDDAPDGLQVVDVAAAEAAYRGVPLAIVHAWPGRRGGLPRQRAMRPDQADGRHLLDLASRRARHRLPGLRVWAELVDDSAAETLIQRSERACLPVVGQRDETVPGHGWGTTAAYVATTAAARCSFPAGRTPCEDRWWWPRPGGTPRRSAARTRRRREPDARSWRCTAGIRCRHRGRPATSRGIRGGVAQRLVRVVAGRGAGAVAHQRGRRRLHARTGVTAWSPPGSRPRPQGLVRRDALQHRQPVTRRTPAVPRAAGAARMVSNGHRARGAGEQRAILTSPQAVTLQQGADGGQVMGLGRVVAGGHSPMHPRGRTPATPDGQALRTRIGPGQRPGGRGLRARTTLPSQPGDGEAGTGGGGRRAMAGLAARDDERDPLALPPEAGHRP
ncbi:universal stress protein [Actinoplanes sp. NEAU-A11]|uniref:Universal stress protein n=1 Tax=Actinoplanes aureus TaxID=2792083 RepID=A0A931CG60_9ACTN|nr:universal stress protein [Actinoplanes aureus]